MNGIARIAITIISQSRCLRSNFIITEQIVEAAKLSRKLRQEIPNLRLQRPGKQSANLQINRERTLGFGSLEFVWNLDVGIWDFLQIARCFLNHFPRRPQMLLRCEHVTETNSHYRSIA